MEERVSHQLEGHVLLVPSLPPRVPGADDRARLTHADAGCSPEPPEIVNGYYNVTGEETCWRTPSEGSVVRYYCLEGYDRTGPSELVCRNGSWVLPSSGPQMGAGGVVAARAASRPLMKQIICGRRWSFRHSLTIANRCLSQLFDKILHF